MATLELPETTAIPKGDRLVPAIVLTLIFLAIADSKSITLAVSQNVSVFLVFHFFSLTFPNYFFKYLFSFSNIQITRFYDVILNGKKRKEKRKGGEEIEIGDGWSQVRKEDAYSCETLARGLRDEETEGNRKREN